MSKPPPLHVVNAKDFGAKCDGVTDDTNAFRAALDHLASLGGGTLAWDGTARIKPMEPNWRKLGLGSRKEAEGRN